ncbi:MADS-box transcription factor 20 [Rhynchospora pubera]|uniref:MADS-box transcription factor 20 n=1 Tax=Rhynchospora pubera TaxID=906938 RepID=A0AAV8G8T8_9POAL|nr:MADS-box transcription factor 20 [Rhynchospora pubera]
MGRRKIVIERKETMAKRQTYFNKRHVGLIKKAYELSVLCNVDASLIMYSPKGDLRHFSTKSPNAAKVLQGLVGHLKDMSEEERARFQLPQDIVNRINRTAAQDDAADQPGPDTTRRELIKSKNRELRLLQETKRMVYPSMETLYSSSERQKLERCLETCLSAIVELKRKYRAQQMYHQQGVQARGMGYPSSVQVQMQAGRNSDPSHGGRQLQHQQVVSAGGMGYVSGSSSSMLVQSEEEASLAADLEMHEAVQQHLHPPVDSFDGSII